ncbi:dihydrofolate reductase family protein [Pontixanthobacter gangjinensis]|uniref:Dihydrofolate reductase n=1 Tax=Christiangramia aestuarii TaxID=1028746 RepID=A0A7M3SWK6_9FLAO|nr:dihydrofolate reductase family protein [Christiangramia aestuarii]MUP40987.1 dihydrofolate reductase [Christiangramia aestuarii]
MNKVFIATSLDGYIADKNGGIDWLHSIPNPDQTDMGYSEFMAGIDAIMMGRNTFETVCGFDMDWPYQKPVYVLSHSLTEVPDSLEGKVEILNGPLKKVLKDIHAKGYNDLYIDGGKTIQSFLKEDLIEEICITIIPVLLGDGIRLFQDLPKKLDFECISTRIFLEQVVQNHFRRKRTKIKESYHSNR